MKTWVAMPYGRSPIGSGIGTNLNVGHRSGAKVGGGHRKKFLMVLLHFFGCRAQLVVLLSAFMMVSTI